MSKTTDIGSITNSVLMAMDKEFRKNEVYSFPRKHNAVRPIVHAIVASSMSEYQKPKANVSFVVSTAETASISNVTNMMLRTLDHELRKNDIFAFPTKHAEIRPIFNALVTEIMTDHIAEMVLEETHDERYVS